MVWGLIPRYDVGPLVLSRMLGINTRLEKLCSKEDVMYVDVWDHFSNDWSLFSEDGLHLNRVGKARLGRVLDEGVKYELIRNKAKLPKRRIQSVQTSHEVIIGDGQVEFRPLSVDKYGDRQARSCEV